MKFLILLILATAASADRRCTGVYFSDRYYDLKIIKDGVNKIHQMVHNRNDNTLYFIYEQIGAMTSTSAGYLALNSGESGVIDVRNASGIAIDQVKNKVFIGGDDGLFLFHNKSTLALPVRDQIRSVFFKDVIFYTNRRNRAYIFDTGDISPVFELQGVDVEKIVLDDDHNIFFTFGRELFRVKIGTRAVNSHERHKVDFISSDAYNRLYAGTSEGVYVYNKYKYVLDKVSNLLNLKALTFSKDDEPIYAVFDSIVKLSLSPVSCFEH